MCTHINIFLQSGNMTFALILCMLSLMASGRSLPRSNRLKPCSASLGVLLCDVEMNLTRSLLSPIVYDKSVRPARDHRDVTNVSFDLSLAQLIDVDEKNQIITTNQWITMVRDGEGDQHWSSTRFRFVRVGSIRNWSGNPRIGTTSVYCISNMTKFGYLISFSIM